MGVLAKEIEATYEVLSKMGEGGMGAVYKVRHRFFDEVRVIKVMQAEIEAVDELKERFLGEAKRGKQLRHPNLAEVIDFSVAADGTSYMVMEYIEGMNLRELMTRNEGPLDYKTLIPIAVQALAALGYLHEKKFVHRDISPDNIMLTNDGASSEPRVKLIDLGIAKSMEATRHLTMAGKFIGKVQYASPEQFSGRVDARSDLYSFGVVLYELLTGAKPVTGKDYFSIIGGHLSRPPRSFAETDPGSHVPETIRVALLKALEKDPGNRFQSAAEFSEALRATLSPSEQSTLVIPIPTTRPAALDPQRARTEDGGDRSVTQSEKTQGQHILEQTALAVPRTIVASSPPRWYPAVAIIALVLVVVVAGLWFQSARRATPPAVPVPSASDTIAAPVTASMDIPSVPANVPAAEPGQLLINAFPWGQVMSVKDASGAEWLTGGTGETPLLLLLPPGNYKVQLANPNSNGSAGLDATVTSNALSRIEAELDRVDAVQYVNSIGIGR